MTLARLAATLRSRRPDGILDLQRSRLSRLLTWFVSPPAFAAFDRFAPEHAIDRYLAAIERLGLGRLSLRWEPRIRPAITARACRLLEEAGHDPERPLVCLNPAGGWKTKQWSLERYCALGQRLATTLGAQILLLGAGPSLQRIRALKQRCDVDYVDLSGRTSADEAMALLARVSLVVSDDSGLMHLASVQGIPTVAIFGATRGTWSRPLGKHTRGFYSEDLPCGACMQASCAREDFHCLDRVSAEAVFEQAMELVSSASDFPGIAS